MCFLHGSRFAPEITEGIGAAALLPGVIHVCTCVSQSVLKVSKLASSPSHRSTFIFDPVPPGLHRELPRWHSKQRSQPELVKRGYKLERLKHMRFSVHLFRLSVTDIRSQFRHGRFISPPSRHFDKPLHCVISSGSLSHRTAIS